MRVEVRLFATFRDAVGRNTLTRTVGADGRIGDLLRGLEAEYPELDLLDGGEPRDHLHVVLDGRDVVHLDGLDTRLEDGDRVSVIPPVEGG